MYKKYLLSAVVLFAMFTMVSPQTTHAFWFFDYFKQSNVQKSEDLTGAVVKTSVDDGPQITVCQLVDLFISMKIIPSDQVDRARQAVFGHCSGSSFSSSSFSSSSFSKSSSSSSSTTPYISDINPKSGSVGSKITLSGRGFTKPIQINFGDGMIKIDDSVIFYPCSDDTNIWCIDFKVPSTIDRDCYYQTPKCLVPTIPIKSGRYPIFITNSRGTSNTVYFQVASSSSSSTSSSGSSSSSNGLPLTLSDLSSKSFLIDNGDRAPATSTVKFQFTMNNVGVSPLYVSKTPSVLVSTSTTSGSLGALDLLSVSADSASPLILAGDTNAYYIIPIGSSRRFTLDGFFGKYSTSGAIEFKIIKIYFSDEKKGLQKFNINSGLEKLRAVAIF